MAIAAASRANARASPGSPSARRRPSAISGEAERLAGSVESWAPITTIAGEGSSGSSSHPRTSNASVPGWGVVDCAISCTAMNDKASCPRTSRVSSEVGSAASMRRCCPIASSEARESSPSFACPGSSNAMSAHSISLDHCESRLGFPESGPMMLTSQRRPRRTNVRAARTRSGPRGSGRNACEGSAEPR